MKFVLEVLVLYALYVLGAALLIWRHGGKDRGPTIVVASLMPMIVCAALVVGTFRLLFRSQPRVRPCPVGLAEAEIAVEKRRHKMFGGPSLPTNYASEWARLYGVTLEEEAKKVEKIARTVLKPSYV
jgi:hypothetical protein